MAKFRVVNHVYDDDEERQIEKVIEVEAKRFYINDGALLFEDAKHHYIKAIAPHRWEDVEEIG